MWIRASASWAGPTMLLFERRYAACVAQMPAVFLGLVIPDAVRASLFPKLVLAEVALQSLRLVA